VSFELLNFSRFFFPTQAGKVNPPEFYAVLHFHSQMSKSWADFLYLGGFPLPSWADFLYLGGFPLPSWADFLYLGRISFTMRHE
jgi:hypothetical protein